MSIAGIAKEVTTITISAWFFGDKLTPLNITGVGITVCGIGLFTYHKYRKAIDSPVSLDERGALITGAGLDSDEQDYRVELVESARFDANNQSRSGSPLLSAADRDHDDR